MAKKQSWMAVIAEEVRAVKDDPRSLRRFGLTMGVALAAFGGLFLWRDKPVAPHLLVLAVVFLLLAAVAPKVLKPIQRVWMTFAMVLGWAMTRVLLVIVFYVGITPIALLAKLVGKRFLLLGFEPDRESYWEKRGAPERGPERYESQF